MSFANFNVLSTIRQITPEKIHGTEPFYELLIAAQYV